MIVSFFLVLVKTGVEPSRATGWMCIASFALLLIPASRDSFVLKLMRLPFDRGVAHHRTLGRIFFICEIAHMSVIIRDWGLSVANAHEAFGAGNVIPAWGWAAFASSLLLGVLSIEWFRRRAFEVFYYSHLVMFFIALFSTALHLNVFPFLEAFGVLQSLDITPIDSYLGFYIGLGLPVLLYIIERIQRGVRSDGICGREAGYGVVRAVVVPTGDNGEEVVHLVVSQPKGGTPGHPGAPRIQYHAGQYCFVTFPQLSKVESHPYTISSAPPTDGSYKMGFHIKTLGNHTEQLANLVRGNEQDPSNIQVRVQGPYGSVRFDPFTYRRIILVAGGIGITPLISLVEELLHDEWGPEFITKDVEAGVVSKDSSNNAKSTDRVAACLSKAQQKVWILWSTRSLLEVKLFEKLLAHAWNKSIGLEATDLAIVPRIFLTRGRRKVRPHKIEPHSSRRKKKSRKKNNTEHGESGEQKTGDEGDNDNTNNNSNTANVNNSSDDDEVNAGGGGAKDTTALRREDEEGAPSTQDAGQLGGGLEECVFTGRPDYEAEFERFLCDGEAVPARKGKHDPESTCVLACGPWQMITAAQCAAYKRGFIFHKEVFDL